MDVGRMNAAARLSTAIVTQAAISPAGTALDCVLGLTAHLTTPPPFARPSSP